MSAVNRLTDAADLERTLHMFTPHSGLKSPSSSLVKKILPGEAYRRLQSLATDNKEKHSSRSSFIANNRL